MSISRMNTELNVWEEKEKLETIKQIYGKNLTNMEFSIFCEMGKSTGLNPFLREIWAVKYGDVAASIFIGRDGYRKSAQANPNYDYHMVDAVYDNDNFSVVDGEVSHSYSLKDRGKLFGAYAITKRKNSSKPNFVFVELKEYSTGKSLWSTKPATMIKKVAESQCFRMAFQNLFAGTYDEVEEPHVTGKVYDVEAENNSVDDMNKALGLAQQYDMSILCKEINDSSSMDDLEKSFKKNYKVVKNNPDHINVITELKNKRKSELENEEFLKAYDAETGEIK